MPQPISPATVPTANTTPATISAAAHSGITVPSASAQATSISPTVQSAQRPATPSPLAIASSALMSERSSLFASSISFFASWVALSITCPISSRFDRSCIAAGTAVCNDCLGGNFATFRGPGSGSFSAMSLSSIRCACSSKDSSPRRARST